MTEVTSWILNRIVEFISFAIIAGLVLIVAVLVICFLMEKLGLSIPIKSDLLPHRGSGILLMNSVVETLTR